MASRLIFIFSLPVHYQDYGGDFACGVRDIPVSWQLGGAVGFGSQDSAPLAGLHARLDREDFGFLLLRTVSFHPLQQEV